jgi:hypothetical protein
VDGLSGNIETEAALHRVNFSSNLEQTGPEKLTTVNPRPKIAKFTKVRKIFRGDENHWP